MENGKKKKKKKKKVSNEPTDEEPYAYAPKEEQPEEPLTKEQQRIKAIRFKNSLPPIMQGAVNILNDDKGNNRDRDEAREKYGKKDEQIY